MHSYFTQEYKEFLFQLIELNNVLDLIVYVLIYNCNYGFCL